MPVVTGSVSCQARQSAGCGAGELRTKEEKRKGMKGSGFSLLRSSQEERKITAQCARAFYFIAMRWKE